MLQPGGLALCVPFCGRPVSPRWAMSLATIAYPLNMTVHYFMIEGVPVAQARQRLVEMALEQKPTYLLFLDDDVVINRMAVQRLLYSLQNADPKAMVMSGVYVTKQDVPIPLIFKKNGGGPCWDWKYGDVFEIEGAGAGCMLIKAEVFEHLPKPWFQWTRTIAENNSEHEITTGEDIYFCQKVKEAGFKVFADGGVLCSHWDQATNRFYVMPKDSYPMREQVLENSLTP